MALFSLLLILVEFPGILLCLRHAPPDMMSGPADGSSSSSSQHSEQKPPATATTRTVIPPLYIVNWIPRGLFYVFLATICFEQAIVVRALDEAKHASTSSKFFDGIFIVVSGWVMLAVGAAYIVLGILCVQRVMERVRWDERVKWAEYHEEVRRVEAKREEEEEREWRLEKGYSEVNGGGAEEDAALTGWWARLCQRLRLWRRRCRRRRARGRGGVFYQMGCRTVDWRC